MLAGYALNGRFEDALKLFIEMLEVAGVSPNPSTMHSEALLLLHEIQRLNDTLAKGKEIHAYAIKNNMASDVTVGSALVDMYACKMWMFEWEEALSLLREMAAEALLGSDTKPNEVTIIAVFAACSHSGLVNEGLDLFYSMSDKYGINPTANHFACVVDLLGRAGKLDAAYELISSMPAQYDKTAGLWEKATEVRKNMKQMGVKKEPGCSWIEFGDKVHKFLAGDALHPQSEQLHGFIEDLSERMKKEGYVPDTSCVLHNLDEEEKESL
uniref:Pentatricopeptide repeat-containing protein n=1 Tax=Chenopodium quinoa TaxID=63459 RepID=A0A803MSU7_CHEQI